MFQIYVKPYWSSPCETVKTGRNEIKSCRKVLDVTPDVRKKENRSKGRDRQNDKKYISNIHVVYFKCKKYDKSKIYSI